MILFLNSLFLIEKMVLKNKNIFHIFCSAILIFTTLFSISDKVSAFILPSFTTKVIVNSIGGDAEFNYNLSSPVNNPQRFGILTQNGSNSYSTGTTLFSYSSSTIYLTQSSPAGWQLSRAICTSTNAQVLTNPYENGVEITVYPNNNVSCTFDNIFDNTPPVITVLGDNPLKITASTTGTYIDPGATSTDNVDGDITSNILTSNDIDITKAGTYSVVYTILDKTGNIASSTRVVEVIAPKKTPVLIIPGILSSYLNRASDNTEVWVNLANAFSSMNDNYLDELILNQNGQPDTFSIIPMDIFRKIEINIPLIYFHKIDFFDGLINELKDKGYIENENLFIFPYDWRLDIRDDMSSLKNKMDEVLKKTDSSRVDIIAHSMGGLLAKEYIKNINKGEVGKFIDIATPHLGAPDAFKNLMYGGNLGIKFGMLGLNPDEIKKISQNMPSIYQLLPSPGYFSDILSDYSYYVDDLIDYDNNSVKGRLNYIQSNEFLKNSGRNSYVLDNSVNIHDDLDSMNPADYGVETYNIVGCKIPTIGKIFTLGNEKGKDPEYEVAYISGDGTVPMRSAENIPSIIQYYITDEEHSTIPSNSSVKKLLSLLLSSNESNFDLNTYQNISTTSENCKLPNGTYLSLHSPVDVNIYDQSGNHTGPIENGDIEYSIPNIAYDIFENNKFIFLPDNQDYQIKLNASDIGSFSSHIKRIVDGSVVSTEYFNDIPLASTNTKAEIELESSASIITLDSAGDDSFKENIEPSANILGDSLQDRLSPITEIEVISPLSILSNGMVSKNATVSLISTDIDSGVLTTQYSFDGNIWQKYSDPIVVSTTSIQYFSTDNSGNIESIKISEIPTTILSVRSHKTNSEKNIILPNINQNEIGNDTISDVISASSSNVSVIINNSDSYDNLSSTSINKLSLKVYPKNELVNSKIDVFLPKIPQDNKKDQKQIRQSEVAKVNNVASVIDANVDSYIKKIYKKISNTFSGIISIVIKHLKL